MLIIQVNVHVKPECVGAFCEATLANARESLQEPGVVRFDVIQELERPQRFMLIEIYRTPDDPVRHKESRHYQLWREKVEPMMAEPRSSAKYQSIFPEARRWETPE